MTLVNKRRVVVTGMGLMTPCGTDIETFWHNLSHGKSGIKFVTQFDTRPLECKIAGEITGFNPEDYLDKKDARRMDRFTQFALAAAGKAYADAGLTPETVDPERIGAIVGCGAGGMMTIENQVREVVEKGYRRTSPFFVPMMISDMAASRISIAYNVQGPNISMVSACASGADSIGNALRMIQYGELDLAFAGGAEAPITPVSIAGFSACRALSTHTDPTTASRPFDRDRNGFVMGEGSVILILEELERARNRCAKIYGEIIGYGRSSDAFDVVAPEPEGRGAMQALTQALKEADIPPESVDYVNAHATSTPQGDIAETKAIKRVFGEHATSRKLLVSSTKSMTGHLIAAAGSMEAAIALLALKNQMIPPTINLENQDPECDLDYVANVARPVSGFKIAVSNSFGFGGHNAALAFRLMENN